MDFPRLHLLETTILVFPSVGQDSPDALVGLL